MLLNSNLQWDEEYPLLASIKLTLISSINKQISVCKSEILQNFHDKFST